eukprot:COSAG01_NODE_25249_length_751_cov_0.863497_1_plen_95_part_00
MQQALAHEITDEEGDTRNGGIVELRPVSSAEASHKDSSSKPQGALQSQCGPEGAEPSSGAKHGSGLFYDENSGSWCAQIIRCARSQNSSCTRLI